MDQYWRAELNPASPRYSHWREIFGRDDLIPLHSPIPIRGKLDGEEEEVYLLDWDRMYQPESDRLIQFVMKKFGVDETTASVNLNEQGLFPIRKIDLIVTGQFPAWL